MSDQNVPFAKTDAGKRSTALHMAKDYFYLVAEKPTQEEFLDLARKFHEYINGTTPPE